MRKLLILLLDGLGDRGYAELGGLSANAAARTPNLDALTVRGACGLQWPLGPGRVPSSERGHWALLGMPPDRFPGRAVLEALGDGQPVSTADALAFAALRPAELRDGRVWVTGRPDRDDPDCDELLESVAARTVSGLDFELAPLGRGEAILRVGGGDPRITDSDPFFRDRLPLLAPRAVVDEATGTAIAVEAWTRKALADLSAHPLNLARAERGLAPLVALTTKWWGRLPERVPTVPEVHGLSGAIVGDSRFLAGLARVLGLDYVAVDEGDDPRAAVAARLAAAAELLAGDATFAFCHLKALDEAGHTKDPRRRVEVLERIDAALGPLDEQPLASCIVAVTGDHATPAVPAVIHSGDPVPLVLAGPGVRADRVHRFDEVDFTGGTLGHLDGSDVLPVLLNAADRGLFAGSRPSPLACVQGFPLLAPELALEGSTP